MTYVHIVSTLTRIIITPLPSPSNISIEKAWLYPVLVDSPSIAKGDLKLVQIQVNYIPTFPS